MSERPDAVEETTLSTSHAPLRPEGVPPVLDEAHVGDIRGALGTIKPGPMIASSAASLARVP